MEQLVEIKMHVEGPSGGTNGQEFSDLKKIQDHPESTVAEVRIWSGERVDAIQIVMHDKNGAAYDLDKHGGNGGGYQVLTMSQDEKIVEVSGTYGVEVDSIEIVTSKGKTLKGGGFGGGSHFQYQSDSILGFVGRSGDRIDAIGVVLG